jgi:hypothetical protein
VRPLDHVTVIQQINFVEREQQNLQTHPELSRLASEEVELRKVAQERRRTKETSRSERTAIRPDESRERKGRGGAKKPKDKGEKGGRVDLRA